MITLNYYGRAVAREGEELITAGSVGLRIGLSFDKAWDTLTKTACFRGSGKAVDVVLSGTGIGNFDPINIPAEVMTRAGARVEVGVYGTNGQGTVVIPAVWAVIGNVKAGAVPSGASPGAITPTLAQQVLAAAEAAQEAAEAAQAAAEAALDAVQPFTAHYTAEADSEYVLTFLESENYSDIELALEAGKKCWAEVTVGDTKFYAPLTMYHNPIPSAPLRNEYVEFRSPSLQLVHSEDNRLYGVISYR